MKYRELTHREKVLARLTHLLHRCPTESQRDMVTREIELAKTCNEDEIEKWAE
jgi:hypothetical protein